MSTSTLGLDQGRYVLAAAPSHSMLVWFAYSAMVHGWLLVLIATGGRAAQEVKRPIYETFIRPNEKKIIWYRKLPEIAPRAKTSDSKDPRGEVKSDKTRIAMMPQPSSSRQLILQAAPQLKLEHDLQAPNLIALTGAPAPPAPPKQAKLFVPPPLSAPAPVATPLLADPEIELAATDPSAARLLPGLTSQIKVPAKPFTPPPSRKPSGNGGSGGSILEAAPTILPAGSNINAAIIGLNPTQQLDVTIPSGSRPAQFSVAPTVGKTSTGEVNGAAGVSLPGIMIREGKEGPEGKARPSAANGPSPPVPPGSRIVLYSDLVRKSLLPSMSVPMRPVSRSIPRALESRFRGRFVYVVIVPAPSLPAYAGDWIVWFAEQEQKPAEVTLMRAPMPIRKTELANTVEASGDQPETRIQLSAVLKTDGKFHSVAMVKGPDSPAVLSAIADLMRWEFRPASRDGSPVNVEVVIEIPFRLASLSGAQ